MDVRVPCRAAVLPSLAGHHDHLVEFYEGDDFLVETVSGFIGPALQDGDGAIIVATPAHRAAFDLTLRASCADVDVDLDAAAAAGRYLVFDGAVMLTAFMVDGSPDVDRFRSAIGAMIEQAAAGGRRVRIYGEMVAILWDAGDVASAVALEEMWNDLADSYQFALLCAYPMRAFDDPVTAEAFERICGQHTSVIPSEGYSMLDDPLEQHRVVARLQQEVASLRTDAARLRAEQEVLAELAYVDGLTGLANRRSFDMHLAREWALSIRDGIDSFVLVADLDSFKEFNDRHGHAAGDEALRQFAGALRVAARSTDIVARIGGDEFGILLSRCHASAAHRFRARIREAMAEQTRPELVELDVSLGHASLHRSKSAADALECADRAMFASKRAARLGPR